MLWIICGRIGWTDRDLCVCWNLVLYRNLLSMYFYIYICTFELPNAEQLREDYPSIQFVGSCTNIGRTRIPNPWSNFCIWNCLANSLMTQKTHIKSKAQIATFIFLIITNLITAPAIITAIISLMNHASLTAYTKLSQPSTIMPITSPIAIHILPRSTKNSIHRSCTYIITQTN